jgi:hypothetical protein
MTLLLTDAGPAELLAPGLPDLLCACCPQVVGGDGGLRQSPVQAPSGLFISPGEHYQVGGGGGEAGGAA